ncbi:MULTISPECIES: L-histidine N(alpha)-methyltransferase [Rhodanobacter]|uniref:L-histidine N(alpha)-methyltransferase n=1 Tax=Rhodanobacter TaxID=75309 RepID=UPI0003FFCF5C|nr:MULTISPECIES: L-histidine N(alpha)-methyltransferase [Rhodanobacter]KZC20165.1 dimethylhistidine N-methyltransferase [Rhodanobacter denitrificans]UJJ49968.1 L-histidine N(alpha)-methyltransferase [Rhodanobacter denitrificans]UJJ57840.1 L-histidine N(alpha)-methyltransferase [Rhodanobacter denitrificans]UJM92682.1 L-histidine N(alpha)-methyltransferase [Rhodanobacter denitrificans]UJM96212.1 L-histidine N(alpha)-methyltransferase [Rhodanobacter denitrificans]
MSSVQPFGLSDDERRPPSSDLLEVVQRGLGARPKRLPSWLFYDERGSALFERICEQPEYYLTRCEIALMDEHAADIAGVLGSGVRLVEYGSGNAHKTRMLLQHLHEPVAYVPVEISPEPLRRSVERLAAAFPQLPLQPLCADFSKPLRLPIPPRAPRRTVLYFPGSTIGNFDNREAAVLLRKMRNEMGDAGGILIGADLKKDPALIEAAYNDRAGVTAEFTLNMLARLNREIGSNFELSAFAHRAHYNPMAGRIETHIVSRREQQVKVGRVNVPFRADEAIQVEYSCKYSLEDFAALAARAGLTVQRVWTDPQRMFSVQYLVRAGALAR